MNPLVKNPTNCKPVNFRYKPSLSKKNKVFIPRTNKRDSLGQIGSQVDWELVVRVCATEKQNLAASSIIKKGSLAGRVSFRINWKQAALVLSAVAFLCLIAAAGATSTCPTPKGPYLSHCTNIQISRTPRGTCILTADCHENFIVTVPSEKAKLKFEKCKVQYKPEVKIILGYEDGALTVQNDEDTKTIVENKPENPFFFDGKGEMIADKKIEVEGLKPGSTISFNSKGEITIQKAGSEISLKDQKEWRRYLPFQELALSTGGLVGRISVSSQLPIIIEKFSEHLLTNTKFDQALDIALILDSTSSMSDDIQAVKDNLTALLENLKKKASLTPQIAIVEFRDRYDEFKSRINTKFTTNIQEAQTNLNKISVEGGGDEPEAAYDALITAQKELSWRKNSKRAVLLITDAPPHSKTIDGLLSQEDVVKRYKDRGIEIAIYPIVTNKT